jgi:hypothetical protein
LPYLPEIVPEVLEEFQALEGSEPKRAILVAALDLLTGLYDRVPSFMGSYIPSVIPAMIKLVNDEPSIAEARDSAMRVVTQSQAADICVDALSHCLASAKRKRKVFKFDSKVNIDS